MKQSCWPDFGQKVESRKTRGMPPPEPKNFTVLSLINTCTKRVLASPPARAALPGGIFSKVRLHRYGHVRNN